MQHIQQGYRGCVLLFGLYADRLVIPLAILVGLIGGAMIGAELMQLQPQDLPAIH